MEPILKRFVAPDGGTGRVPANEYLSEVASRREIDLLQLADRPAILLTGEPGSGKSHALRQLYVHLSSTHPEWVLGKIIDLRQHNPGSVEIQVFNPVLTSGAKGPQQVLFLDGIDECRDSPRDWLPVLRHALPRIVDLGVHVLATCRTAELLAPVKQLFTSLVDGIDVMHELLPLRQSDIKAYVDAYGLDGDVFLESVRLADAVPLAAIPITLKMLTNVTHKDPSLFRDRANLYEAGVTDLLDAVEDATDQLSHTIPSSTRMLIAERAAALVTLSGAQNVWIGSGRGREGSLPYEHLSGSEPNSGEVVQLSLLDVQDVLRSPLFADDGAEQRVIVHRSFGSYLTARYLARRKMPVKQVRSLLSAAAVEGSIVPQLREIAAWLAVLDVDHRDWIIDVDPFTIVTHRLAPKNDRVRERLVKQLLSKANDIQHLMTWAHTFPGLEHPGLADQLRLVLRSVGAQRMLALNILADSYVQGLEEELRQLVVDTSATSFDRRLAISILAANGAHHQLADIVRQGDRILAGDQHQELLGALLDSTWPSVLPTEDMFRLLQPVVKEAASGYRLFMKNLADRLADTDLDIAASWAIANARHESRTSYEKVDNQPIQELVDAICCRLANSGSESHFAVASEICWIRIDQHRDLPVEVDRLQSRRHLLIENLATRTAEVASVAAANIRYAKGTDEKPLVLDDDFEWVCRKALDNADTRVFDTWAQLARTAFNPDNPVHEELAWAHQGSPLWPSLEGHFWIDRNSELATALRRREERLRALEMTEEDCSVDTDSYLQQVRSLITATSGEPERLWVLSRLLEIDLSQSLVLQQFPEDLTSTQGYSLLNSDEKQAVDDAAYRYLDQTVDHPLPIRSDTTTLHFKSAAAYQALYRWAKLDTAKLDALSAKHWQGLAETILTHHATDTEIKQYLLGQLASRAPGKLVEAVVRNLAIWDMAGQMFTPTDDLTSVMSAELAASLQTYVDTRESVNAERLINLMLGAGYSHARDWCLAKLSQPDASQQNKVIAAAALMRHIPRLGLSATLQALQRDEEKGRELALALAGGERFTTLFNAGRDDIDAEVADVYEWLSGTFPPSEDPARGWGFHFLDQRDLVAHWRNKLLNVLMTRGTPEGLGVLTRLHDRRPDVPQLEGALVIAREHTRKQSWRPPPIGAIKEVLAASHRRLVTNSAELQAVVLEQLQVMQGWLAGETPQAFALWNTTPNAREPKDENTLSDWYCHGLRLLLAGRGVIAGREVEVRRVKPHGVGQRQDIRIDAVRDGTYDTCSVIIEVKGCWNTEWKTAIDNQLVGQYLAPQGLGHGILLVVCFPPDQVDNDSKRRLVSNHAVEALEAEIQKQAAQVAIPRNVAAVVHRADMPRATLPTQTASS